MLYRELLAGIEVLDTNLPADAQAQEVCADTRKITPGCAFVCMKGTRTDSHSLAKEAVAQGAGFVVCQAPVESGVPFVRVENTRAAFTRMNANLYHNPQNAFRYVIGLTGTNGKTSTSYMLKAIFDQAGYKTGLIGTMKYLVGDREYPVDKKDNLLTTPDPDVLFGLLDQMRREEVQVLIMETSSHALKLDKLQGIHFSAGIFTNLTQDHLDFHKNMDDYLASKKKLFDHCDLAVVNFDDPSFAAVVKELPCPYVSFSGAQDNRADYIAKNVRLQGAAGVSYECLTRESLYRVRLPIPGSFSVSNSLAAVACAMKLGIGEEHIVPALASMDNVKGRIDRVKIDADYSVFIDFAHTPDALQNVLKTLRQFATGRIITLFGCGGDRDRTKRPLMARVAAALSDVVIVTSDNSRSEEKADIIADILVGMEGAKCSYHVVEDRTQAIHLAMDLAQKDDIVLLAGKGHEEYEIDKTGKHAYSERDVVCEYFNKKGSNK